jgi:hypothetical protein
VATIKNLSGTMAQPRSPMKLSPPPFMSAEETASSGSLSGQTNTVLPRFRPQQDKGYACLYRWRYPPGKTLRAHRGIQGFRLMYIREDMGISTCHSPKQAGDTIRSNSFDENNKLMFELSEIKDPTLILDKTNFQHAGWFRFELYDGDQLKEKNKLFIPKEF